MAAHFTTTVCCYSSTNVSDETDIITFNNELCSLVRQIPKHNDLIIGGVMNAQIRKGGNNKFCSHNKLKKSSRVFTRKHASMPKY